MWANLGGILSFPTRQNLTKAWLCKKFFLYHFRAESPVTALWTPYISASPCSLTKKTEDHVLLHGHVLKAQSSTNIPFYEESHFSRFISNWMVSIQHTTNTVCVRGWITLKWSVKKQPKFHSNDQKAENLASLFWLLNKPNSFTFS